MTSVTNPADLPGPFEIAAAWRGTELFDRKDWVVELHREHLDEIDAALHHAESLGGDVEAATIDDFPLPRLSDVLHAIQDRLEHGSGACLIRGLSVDRYTESQLRRIFWGLATRIGTPVSQSAAGERIFSVRDEGWKEKQPQARGPNTRKRLSFHTDRCDVIAFLCLKQAISGGANQLVSSVALYNEMRSRWPESLRALMQSFWYMRHTVDVANPRPYCQQPIFSCHEGHFAASYLRVLIDRAAAMPSAPDLSDQQLEALDRLESLAADPAFHVTIRQEPGDLLLLNNWTTFHRRDEFADSTDAEQRRHILRIWLAVPNSRPLDPRFADNYGSTAAGAVRGGMSPASE